MHIMKLLIYYFIAYIFLVTCGACKKTTAHYTAGSSLNIINAINGSNPIVTDFQPLGPKGVQNSLEYYATANSISYASSWESGSYTGNTYLSLSQMPDTMTTLWAGSLNLKPENIYSFFLCGDTTAVDTLFTTDVLPNYIGADSLAGVRFVNLTESSQPMSVNIQGNSPTQTEFSGLAYKQISAFKSYSANSSVPGFYNFEIRDLNTDSLLQTFTWAYTLSRNQTIVICGQEGVTSNYPITIFSVNNY